jgi:hypothetical protein
VVGGYPKQKESSSAIRKYFRCQRSCLLFADIALNKKNWREEIIIFIVVCLPDCVPGQH